MALIVVHDTADTRLIFYSNRKTYRSQRADEKDFDH